MATHASAKPTLGPRNLSFIHAVGQTLAIGPIFSAGVLIGLVGTVAGFSAPLSILIGSLGALALGYVVSLFAQTYTGAGAVYEYLARSTTTSLGVIAAGIYFLGTLFTGSGGIYLAIGFFGSNFLAEYLNLSLSPFIVGLLALVLVFLLNHYGVRITINAVITFAILAAIPFVILAVATVLQGGAAGNTLRTFLPVNGWGATLYGVLYAVLLFVGFEAAASISEEMHSPKSHIPIAVLLTIMIGTAFYALMGYASTIGFGEQAITAGAWQNAASPFHDLATQYVGSWLAPLVDLAIILDMLSLALAFMVTTARGVFALARDRLLPRSFTAISRHHTPLAGNLVVVAWSIFLLALSWLWNWQGTNHLPPIMQWFSITATTGSFLVELIYLLLAIAAVRLIIRRNGGGFAAFWRCAIVLVGALVPLLAFRGALWPFPAYPDSLGAWLALLSILLVGGWYLALQAMRPEAIERAALHATEL